MNTSEEEIEERMRGMQARDCSFSSPFGFTISWETRKVKIKQEKVEEEKNHSRLDINFEWIEFHCLTFYVHFFTFFCL